MHESTRQADIACGPEYCPAQNAYVMASEIDPQNSSGACRTIAKPAGINLPCATVQLPQITPETLVPTLASDGFTAATLNPLIYGIYAGCPDNSNGCEFVSVAADKASKFAVDQNGNTTNIAVNQSVQSNYTIVDIQCYRGELYVLATTSSNALLYTFTQNTLVPISVARSIGSGQRATSMCFKDNLVFVGTDGATGGVSNLYVFTRTDFGPVNAVNLGGVRYVADLTICGSLLILGKSNTSGASTDEVQLLTVSNSGAGLNSVYSATLPDENCISAAMLSPFRIGLTKHPLCNVVYMTAYCGNGTAKMYSIKFTDDGSTVTVQKAAKVEVTTVSDTLGRLRPVYRSGVIQLAL